MSIQLKQALSKRPASSSASTARRLPPVKPEDCTEKELQKAVFLSCVCIFGVSSAGYWWGRAAGAIVRLTHYFLGHEDAIWALIYSDDGNLMAGEEWRERSLLLHLFVLVVLGVPLAWHKVRGGVEEEWIGYWLDYSRFEIGISESRTKWCIRWLRDTVSMRRVAFGEMREALGRLVFATGPLEFLRPILGPLFSWASAGPRHRRPKLPAMILLLLTFLADKLEVSHMAKCEDTSRDLGELFRLDASAGEKSVSVGGWLCAGGRPTREAPWFSIKLDRRSAPWASARPGWRPLTSGFHDCGDYYSLALEVRDGSPVGPGTGQSALDPVLSIQAVSDGQCRTVFLRMEAVGRYGRDPLLCHGSRNTIKCAPFYHCPQGSWGQSRYGVDPTRYHPRRLE